MKSQLDRKKELIYEEIFGHPRISRLEIAKRLKMRATTVSDLVQELMDDHLVEETRTEPNGMRGRPVLMLTVAAARFVCISIYPEDFTLIGSLVDLDDTTLAETSFNLSAEADNDDFLLALDSILSFLISKVPEQSELIGAGISLVGTVDAGRKIWIEAIRWPHIKDVDFHPVEQRIGVSILLKRWLDTELEYLLMRNPEYRTGNSLLFHWGTGIGVAFAHEGNVISSRFGKFADVGHTFVDPDPRRVCRCGHRGCLEAVAAIWALVPVLRKNYPEMQENIHEVRKVLRETDVIRDPDFQYALGKVRISLSNLFKLLLPDRLFFIGPFTQDPRIFREIQETISEIFTRNIYRSIEGRVSMEVVQDQFRFCKIANVRPFFRDTLGRVLKARGLKKKARK